MGYTVYIIQSEENKRRYIGYTSDMETRLRQHNEGVNASTRNKGPWKVIYREDDFVTREAALKREKELKRMKGGIQLQKLLEDQE